MMTKSRQVHHSRLLILTSLLLVFANHSDVSGKQDHNPTPIELSGFSLSEAYEIPDDKPLNLDAPMLKQLLYRIKRTSPKTRLQYSRFSQDLTWPDITTKTEDHRLWLFDRPARLNRIEKYRFRNLGLHEEVEHVFVCHCETEPENRQIENGGRGQPFLILARTVPGKLPTNVAIDEPIRFEGFLYARISGIAADDNNEMPVFIADRVAWYPTEPSENVSAAHANLARHRVDIGLLDLVRENNTRPLDSRDAEAFFQILAAVNQLNDEDVIPKPIKGGPGSTTTILGFTDLIKNANANFGQAVRVAGMVRTCSVISVPDQDIKNRLGVSKYYQLMLFPDLDGTKIVVKSQDGTKMDYRRFPITICCTELPAGMRPADLERKQFVVEGYFFRFWKFQTDKTDQAEASGQVSPLIIAKIPLLIESDTSQLNLVLMIFVIMVIVGIIVLIGGYRIADRGRQTAGQKILSSLPAKIDLSDLED